MRKCFLIAMMLGISTLAISAQKTSKSLKACATNSYYQTDRMAENGNIRFHPLWIEHFQ